MWGYNQPAVVQPNIEQIRKSARILVIDDQTFPHQVTFERDGYHFERWPEIKNLSQLTDGHYHLILLDIQGVGLEESPGLQGLGVLQHIKKTNPAQMVVLYSAQSQRLSHSKIVSMADIVLEKGMDYIEYKGHVDDLLLRRWTPAYFIAAMNQALGDQAILAPKAVQKATRSFRRGDITSFQRYIEGSLSDSRQIDTVIGIVQVGLSTAGLVAGG